MQQYVRGEDLERSASHGIDTLTSCGAGSFVLLIVAIVAVVACFWLAKTLLSVILDSKKTINTLREEQNGADKKP